MNTLKNHVFGSFNLNNSEKHRLSFEDIFLGTLDTYTKKMNPPSAVLGGGVHGKVCWLIAYKVTSPWQQPDQQCKQQQQQHVQGIRYTYASHSSCLIQYYYKLNSYAWTCSKQLVRLKSIESNKESSENKHIHFAPDAVCILSRNLLFQQKLVVM